MAQELFILPLPLGTGATFSTRKARAILDHGSNPMRHDWAVRYPDGSGCRECSLVVEEGATIDSIHLMRFGGRTMMERLFALARDLGGLLVWTDADPDGPSACVVGAGQLASLPVDLATDTFVACAVRDADHLARLVTGCSVEDNGL